MKRLLILLTSLVLISALVKYTTDGQILGSNTLNLRLIVLEEGYTTLTVRVLDKEDYPIENAKVSVKEPPLTVYSNSEGIAFFESIPCGEHQLTAEYQGVLSVQDIVLDTELQHEVTVNLIPPEEPPIPPLTPTEPDTTPTPHDSTTISTTPESSIFLRLLPSFTVPVSSTVFTTEVIRGMNTVSTVVLALSSAALGMVLLSILLRKAVHILGKRYKRI